MPLKKIPVSQLARGMYVADLGSEWMDHPFLRSSFPVGDEQVIDEIVAAGIREVYIDPDRGLDVPGAPTEHEVRAQLDREIHAVAGVPAPAPRVGAADEAIRARRVHQEANQIIRNVMLDVRLGNQVAIERVEPVVERVTESVLRNGNALVSLCRLKNKDDYTFQHSVSVCALLVAFCRALDMDGSTLRLAGVGGLLHDLGKVRIADSILNKPGRLTETELATVKRHVVEGLAIIDQTPGIHELSRRIVAEHHERYDGSGYPAGLQAEGISRIGQMAAICDVYDAITSNRVYHKGMAPHEALRRIFEWSRFHFNPRLAQAFVRIIGIYPVGTLVMLESGRIAVVLDQSEGSLLEPRVRVVFDSRRQHYLTPQDLDLSKAPGFGGGDRIVGYESPEKWGIDVSRFL